MTYRVTITRLNRFNEVVNYTTDAPMRLDDAITFASVYAETHEKIQGIMIELVRS